MPETEALMKSEVDVVHRAGNTVGGIFEVVAHNVVTGLGSHTQWDEKLDARLAQAVMSIQAVKGVEIGAGIAAATSYGSEVMDEIKYDAAAKKFTRPSNRAGGLEAASPTARTSSCALPEADLHAANPSWHGGYGDEAAHLRRVRTL